MTLVGPVGVGKTFIAHALGQIACRRGHTVLALRADRLLKMLEHARLDHSYEAELRKLLAIEVLIVDDVGLDAMDATESRDVHEILTERDRAGSIIVTSNRGPDEWLGTFADPVRAQAAIDRFTSNAYDLVIDVESYRKRLKPTSPGSKSPAGKTGQKKEGSGNSSPSCDGWTPGGNAPEKQGSHPRESRHHAFASPHATASATSCAGAPNRCTRSTSGPRPRSAAAVAARGCVT